MIIEKPLFIERMKKLIPDEKDFEAFSRVIHEKPINAIRCNTLKISVDELKTRLEEKGWKIRQPFSDYPEVMIIENELEPGALGNSREHILGYYYIQEISSMLSVIALNPKPGELVLDLCAAPGSKTTQMSAKMRNRGTIIANDVDLERVKILGTNLERCGCANVIVTRHDGVILCEKLKKLGYKFDKILLDVPCSGEGTTRSSPKTFIIWNLKMIEKMSRLQRKLISSAISLLREGGEIVYSTCTYTPEENERNVDFLIKNFGFKTEKINLPLKTRPGITEWQGEKYSEEVKKTCRIYPQDNNTEGFFVCKLRKP
ncbi:MAG: RsmB/NOP family class I SAM-dependent RNA methyltransferase [Candidatus Pacearchaeota archaeon]